MLLHETFDHARRRRSHWPAAFCTTSCSGTLNERQKVPCCGHVGAAGVRVGSLHAKPLLLVGPLSRLTVAALQVPLLAAALHVVAVQLHRGVRRALLLLHLLHALQGLLVVGIQAIHREQKDKVRDMETKGSVLSHSPYKPHRTSGPYSLVVALPLCYQVKCYTQCLPNCIPKQCINTIAGALFKLSIHVPIKHGVGPGELFKVL